MRYFFVLSGLASAPKSQQQQLYKATSNENFNSEFDGDDYVGAQSSKPLNRGPYFDLAASRNVTALVGKTAYLNCRIRNLGNKTVSVRLSGRIYLLLSRNIRKDRCCDDG